MVFKVLLVATLLTFVVTDANDNFVRSKSERKFSLDPAESVSLMLYGTVNCTGSFIGLIPCNGHTCMDSASMRVQSIKVKIIIEISFYIIKFLGNWLFWCYTLFLF
jgi:hypothetical protein